MPITFMPWTDDQLKLAFYLYCQLPFGKLHHRNQEIIKLAELIGRTPSAVAMKLCNFASLDPAVTETGRTGLGNASTRDRKVWADFHADWEGLALEAQRLKTCLGDESMVEQRPDSAIDDFEGLSDFSGKRVKCLLSSESSKALSSGGAKRLPRAVLHVWSSGPASLGCEPYCSVEFR